MPEITQQAEREELERLLASGTLGKAPNVQSFLEFVAEKYFSGEEVKEYQIAVEALHRTPDFNPQADTIVRVTAHSLRKRLDQYYTSEGADHPVQIQLPTGRYALRFVRRDGPTEVEDAADADVAGIEAPSIPPPEDGRRNYARIWSTGALILLIAVAALAYRYSRTRPNRQEIAGPPLAASASSTSAVTPPAGSIIRFLAGDNRHPYTDPSGQIWSTDHFCSGGVSLAASDHRIQGVEESELFRGGRKGSFHCRIPVVEGIYEVHLFFADTEGTQAGAAQIVFRINGGEPQALDVVDLAGANDTATERIFAGIHPGSDGVVHLDFDGEGSFVNAVELLPAPSNRMLPIRMHIGPVVFHDSAGRVWSPDRFFFGGRRAFHPEVLAGQPDARLFQWERYGHFHYSIPVVAQREYAVTLYFKEAWFGVPNGGAGGIGSRAFDVYGDGTTLLSGFDILQQQKNGIARVTFHHVRPTAQDLIDIYFSPVKNYALVNAIEIEEES